ncbi:MAG: hypothetical protein JST39_19465, partial [Bacteroidetes bacterium]|nr:hypothetical protein [Bacteroidota bacterium]
PHVRAKRGSIKPARLNKVLKKSAGYMGEASFAAKCIFDAVRIYQKDGDLWNNLVKIFRKQIKAGQKPDVRALERMECHSVHKLGKLLSSGSLETRTTIDDDGMQVKVSLSNHPDWSHLNWKRPYQYRLSVLAVFPFFEKGRFISRLAQGPVTDFSGEVQSLSFDIPVPRYARSYVVYLLANVNEDGEDAEQAHTRGMRAECTGIID